MVPDLSHPSIVYAGTAQGVFRSDDAGVSWRSASAGLPPATRVQTIAIDPTAAGTLYAGTYGSGIFQTTNGALAWTAAASGMRDAYVPALALAPSSSLALYAGTLGGGVYQSVDGARSWTASNAGLPLGLVYSVVSDSASPGTLFAATFEGVQKSADGGGSWQASSNGLPVYPVAALAAAPGSPERLFAGTLGGGLFQSADGGVRWTTSGQGLNDAYVSSIAVDPSSATTLYAGTNHPYDGSNSERVYKSTDGGSSWSQTSLDASSFSIDFLAINTAQPFQVLAGSRSVVGFFQSLDGGKTWSNVSSSAACGGTNAFLFDRTGSTLFLGGTAGVCRSTDAGKTWSVSAVAGGYAVGALAADPSSPPTLYAGASFNFATGSSGIFRSTDGGQTWTAVGSGFPAASVRALAVDGSGRLHAGTFGGGVVELISVADRQPPVESPTAADRRARALNPR